MKKFIFSIYPIGYKLLLILCAALFTFTSCSDDNNPEQNIKSYLDGDYTLNSQNYKLDATLNDIKISDASALVSVSSTGSNTLKLVLKNIIPGQSTVTLNNITLTEDTSQGRKIFSGTTNISSSQTISYSGSITMAGFGNGGTLTIHLKNK